MFRTNYLPKCSIFQCSKTGKYICNDGDYSFVEDEDGEYWFSLIHSPTRFDTIEDIVSALYEYAKKKHLDDIHKKLTYSSHVVKV